MGATPPSHSRRPQPSVRAERHVSGADAEMLISLNKRTSRPSTTAGSYVRSSGGLTVPLSISRLQISSVRCSTSAVRPDRHADPGANLKTAVRGAGQKVLNMLKALPALSMRTSPRCSTSRRCRSTSRQRAAKRGVAHATSPNKYADLARGSTLVTRRIISSQNGVNYQVSVSNPTVEGNSDVNDILNFPPIRHREHFAAPAVSPRSRCRGTVTRTERHRDLGRVRA